MYVQMRRCGGEVCPLPASSLSSGCGTGSDQAQVPPTAGLLLAASSPSLQTHLPAVTLQGVERVALLQVRRKHV